MRTLVWGGLLVCACSTPPSPSSELEPLPPPPAHDADEAARIVQQAVMLAPTVHPDAGLAVYDRAMTHQSPTCPYETNGFWYDACEGPEASYTGYVFSESASSGTAFEDLVFGSAQVVAGERVYDLSGSVQYGEADGRLGFERFGAIYGTFRDTGASDWTAYGDSLSLAISAIDRDGTVLTIDGGWSGLAGPGTAAVFESTTWFDDCSDAPDGVIRVRDPHGHWTTYTFDDCDPCAEGVDDFGAAVGTACITMPLPEEIPW